MEFRLDEIEHLPVADARVDVVIATCVINLSPAKPQVWRGICPDAEARRASGGLRSGLAQTAARGYHGLH
jgi:hypothetical protein